MAARNAAPHDALNTGEGSSMTPQDKALELREAVVASNPTNHNALIGHVGASRFPIGGPDALSGPPVGSFGVDSTAILIYVAEKAGEVSGRARRPPKSAERRVGTEWVSTCRSGGRL